MEPLARTVQHLIETQFTGAQADLEDTPGGRVSGAVLWDGFTGHDQADRQEQVRGYLRQALNGEFLRLGLILLYTPAEWEAMRAA